MRCSAFYPAFTNFKLPADPVYADPLKQFLRPLLDTGLVSAVLAQPIPTEPLSGENTGNATTTKVVEIQGVDPPRRIEQIQPDSREAPSELVKQVAPPLYEKFDQEKRILFTKGESQAIDRLVASLAARVGAQVKVSHVMRALVALLLHAEGELDKRAGDDAGPLSRPANGDAQALQRFEREIANIVAAALRDAGPLRSDYYPQIPKTSSVSRKPKSLK